MTAPELTLLRTRLEALIGDVEEIRTSVAGVGARSGHLKAISVQLREAVEALQLLGGEIGDLPQRLRELENYEAVLQADPGLVDRLGKSKALAQVARSRVVEVRQNFSAIERSLVKIDRSNVLISKLSGMCGTLRRQLKKLQQDLDNPQNSPKGLWSRYDELVTVYAQPLFDAYVDYVGGLAVRDNRLDQEICTLSDDLINSLVNQTYLSIPAREAALSLTAMIKLGFPEWTVWGVPLAAHEAGLSVLTTHNEAESLRETVADFKDDFDAIALEHLFADALAAFTVGPAYAHALFELRLRPDRTSSSLAGMPADGDRARLVLRVLDGLSHSGTDFASVVGRLSKMWEDAERGTLDRPSPLVLPAGSRLAEFADRMLEQLQDFDFTPVSDARWSAVDASADLLLAGDSPAPVPGTGLIDLLNAAWLARTRAPDDTEAIARRLVEAHRRLVSRSDHYQQRGSVAVRRPR
jgi:hypothetical protein